MGSSVKDLTNATRTALNPNAAEFVPSALRALPTRLNHLDVINPASAPSSGKAALARNDSVASVISEDDTGHWQVQLPDDITPDFDLLEEHSMHGCEGFQSEGASALDYTNTSRPAPTANEQVSSFPFSRRQKQISRHAVGRSYDRGDSKSAFSQHCGGRSSAGVASLPSSRSWMHKPMALDQQAIQRKDGPRLICGSDVTFLSKLVKERPPENGEMDPEEFLAMEFPGFAAKSPADIFHANGSDVGLTVEMLTQLEPQDDAGPPWGAIAESSSSLNLTMPDFAHVPSSEMVSCYTGDEILEAMNIHSRVEENGSFFYRSKISADSQTAIDFVLAARRSASQHSGQCHYERNGAMDHSLRTSRISEVATTFFTGDVRVSSRDMPHAATQPTRQHPLQMWLDTGESVANTCSDLRNEGQDAACVQNTYFESARQAWLIGNKAFVKELTGKVPWHNGQMKAAYSRSGDANLHPMLSGNLATGHLPNYSSEQVRLIDLHELHVSEAIHVLNRELAVLRCNARSTCQRQHAFICVGTGQHTRGCHASTRLHIVVERYLVEDEHLDYTEPHPGMLQVVIY